MRLTRIYNIDKIKYSIIKMDKNEKAKFEYVKLKCVLKTNYTQGFKLDLLHPSFNHNELIDNLYSSPVKYIIYFIKQIYQ